MPTRKRAISSAGASRYPQGGAGQLDVIRDRREGRVKAGGVAGDHADGKVGGHKAAREYRRAGRVGINKRLPCGTFLGPCANAAARAIGRRARGRAP